ncbi:hypothetical protein QA612_19595 [Evansella sp. AB-P1]|uniref:hypothetical protein n=1 Tax=Evansella sp. AB-P1 TaxID=3037653 RepID=UPI00241D8B6F|nr:hypothetical protein [Evansella sp. AB-P1]MDG5789665.1 hypothetical protein [Evansella sp. AB-P1]
MLLKYKFKEATAEERQELLSEVISQYKITDKAQLVQALAHTQALYDCSQQDFADNSAIGVSVRSIRQYKKDYTAIYVEAFDKYQQQPELIDVDAELEEDALEAVYQNLLTRLQSSKTSTKDLATILEYFGISGAELRQYAQLRNATMRGFYRDNEKALVQDEDTATLVKSLIAESDFHYLGTPKTVGATDKALSIDLDNPVIRLEVMSLGLLWLGLWNGQVSPQFVEVAQTVRLLKLASGDKVEPEQSIKDFEAMDGKSKKLKPVSPKMEKDLINIFGADEGKEMYLQLLEAKQDVDKKTAVKLPKYEDVKPDYDRALKVFPALEKMPLSLILEKLDNEAEDYTDKYNEFLNTEEDNDNE